MNETDRWLEWSRRLVSLAQAGITYSENPFDVERYHVIKSIAAEIAAQGSNIHIGHWQELFAAEKGYTTPKVDVRGAVFQNDRILLVKEKLDHDLWTLPGGWVDPGDTPSAAVEREIREETGYLARATKLAALYDRDTQGHPAYFHSIYKLFFICELYGGSPVESIETGESAFFDENNIPELSIARTTKSEIKAMFRHHHNPALATDFD